MGDPTFLYCRECDEVVLNSTRTYQQHSIDRHAGAGWRYEADLDEDA